MGEHSHSRNQRSEGIEEIREHQKQNSMDKNVSQFTYAQQSNGIQTMSDSSVYENRSAHFFNQQNTMPQPEDFLQSYPFPPPPPPPNLQFPHHIGVNRVNALYPSPIEQYGSGHSYQSPLNAHMENPSVESQTPMVSNKSKRKTIIPNISNNSQSDPLPNRRQNWTIAEDVGLTKAYLYISIDSRVGKDQTRDKMWNRILKVWLDNMTVEYDKTRVANALMCRWSAIQAAATKFHALYESLERAPRSGTSIVDMKEEAMTMYKSLLNQPFRYLHCWEILKKNAKWCSQQLTRTGCSKKQKVNETVSAPSSSTPITIVGDECDDANTQPTAEVTNGDGVARPPGRDTSKDNKKKKSEEKGLVDVLGNIQCALQKQFELNHEDLEFQKNHEKRAYELREEAMKKELELREQAQRKELELKEQAQIKEFELKEKAQLMKEKAMKRKEDLKILNMDLDSLQPLAREAYRKLQAQIMKEWKNEGLFGDVSGNDN